MKHQQLPPTANFENTSAKIDLVESPFTVLSDAKAWEKRTAQTPRRAAVSAFGFGGINAHVLLEEWQIEQTIETSNPSSNNIFFMLCSSLVIVLAFYNVVNINDSI